MRRRQPGVDYNLYSDFRREQMILRDFLAADRTVLSNERTFLSYTRTALAFLIGGASAIHFVSGVGSDVVGIILIAFGIVTFGIGVRRYRWFRKRISVLSRPPTDPETQELLQARKNDEL